MPLEIFATILILIFFKFKKSKIKKKKLVENAISQILKFENFEKLIFIPRICMHHQHLSLHAASQLHFHFFAFRKQQNIPGKHPNLLTLK